MKETNYWEQFLNSGSVEAYLQFRENDEGKQPKDMGVNPYAGVSERNRNDTENGACRRI